MSRLLRNVLSTALWVTSLTVLLLGIGSQAAAHDIPGRVAVVMYVKQESNRLLVMVRVPREALTEIQFPPTSGSSAGYLGPDRADSALLDSALADAAKLYLIDALAFSADDVALARGTLLRARFSKLGDLSFRAMVTAEELLQSPSLVNEEAPLGWFDAAIAYPYPGEAKRFSIDAHLERLGVETRTVLHFVSANGSERVFTYLGAPGRIQLDPGFWDAASRFVAMGFGHILGGIDHLLFLFCLILVARSVWALVPVVTAFTIAHSITLVSATLGLTPAALWFAPLIETLIAASILYTACENALGVGASRRWMVVFAFGLVHGFGFSFMLVERMQFAGSHLPAALFAFNVGVEIGQLLVICLLVPVVRLLFRYLPSERAGVILLSALAAHTAWHWFTARGSQLLEYQWQWPPLDAYFLAAAMRWAMLLIVSGATLWGLSELFERFGQRPAGDEGLSSL